MASRLIKKTHGKGLLPTHAHGLGDHTEVSQHQELLRTLLVTCTCTCIGHLLSRTPLSRGMVCLSLNPTFRNLIHGVKLEMHENSLFKDFSQGLNSHGNQKEMPSGQFWKPDLNAD